MTFKVTGVRLSHPFCDYLKPLRTWSLFIRLELLGPLDRWFRQLQTYDVHEICVFIKMIFEAVGYNRTYITK